MTLVVTLFMVLCAWLRNVHCPDYYRKHFLVIPGLGLSDRLTMHHLLQWMLQTVCVCAQCLLFTVNDYFALGRK